MKKTLFAIVFILIFTLSACKQNPSNNTLKLSVSISPIATFVKNVCGDNAEVITMIPAGASAETYEMSPKEIATFSQSAVFFSVGVPAEENGILPHIAKSTKVIDLASNVSAVYPDLKIGNERDPHIWLSPKRAIVMVEEICNELCVLDPQNSENYRKNAADYIEKLQNTDNQILNTFKDKRRKVFYISHPSFSYFADDYGLDMISLEKDGKEVSPKELAEIIDIAKKSGAKVIFCQEEASKKMAEAFAEEIGGKTEILKPLSPDYCNNLLKTATLIHEALH